MLLQQTRAFTASRAGRARTATAVRCQAQRDHSFVQHTAAAAAAMLILAPSPALAVLPEGFKSPSTAQDPEQLYEKLIEQRTGKEAALPELVDVPEVKVTERAVVQVAPMAPALAEPPALAPVVVVETPKPSPPAAEEVSPIRAAAIAQASKDAATTKSTATSAPAGGSNGLVIGGGVAAVLALALVATRGGEGSSEGGAAPAAPAAAAAPAAPASEAAAPAAGDAASGMSGGAPAENPSSKME